jgi:hypothetical protein
MASWKAAVLIICVPTARPGGRHPGIALPRADGQKGHAREWASTRRHCRPPGSWLGHSIQGRQSGLRTDCQDEARTYNQQLCPFTTSMNKNLKNVAYALFAGCFGGLLLPLVMKIPSESSAANVLKWVASVLAIPGAFLAASSQQLQAEAKWSCPNAREWLL